MSSFTIAKTILGGIYNQTLLASNSKLDKSTDYGHHNVGLSLAPNSSSGYDMCVGATPGCISNCIFSSGKGKFSTVQAARIWRTRWLVEDPDSFMMALVMSIVRAEAEAKRLGLKLAVRPNVFSDVKWEEKRIPMTSELMDWLDSYHIHPDKTNWPTIITLFPLIQFYDYTKLHSHDREIWEHNGHGNDGNYNLTFSASAENHEYNRRVIEYAVDYGYRIAMVATQDVSSNQLRDMWERPVIDGDQHDLRFLDEEEVLVRLKPKGFGKRDTTGFVFTPDSKWTPPRK